MKGKYRLMDDLAEVKNLAELVVKAGEACFFVRAVAASMAHGEKAPLRSGLSKLAHMAADRAAEVHRHLEAALKARDERH